MVLVNSEKYSFVCENHNFNMSNLDEEAVDHFKQYLRIPSEHPDCDYSECVRFLTERADSIGLEWTVVEVAPSKPVVVMTWTGREPGLPSLLLSSHMDVVPVYLDQWHHDPFSAFEDDSGNIYARGAQDMKSVGIQYLEAIHRLILQKHVPKRTVHICFNPDEEIGSDDGVKIFVKTSAFTKLNVGCVLDEGATSEKEFFLLFFAERSGNPFDITISGKPGHGSLLLDNTVGEKLSSFLARIMEKRAEEKNKLKKLFIGDVTSINLTKISGGVQVNVVPSELKASFDVRMSIDTSRKDFECWISDVCNEAGGGIDVEYFNEETYPEVTKLDEDNQWWVKLKSVFDDLHLKLMPIICPGGTDARFYRKLGIPAFGFSPIHFTKLKMHDHNEFLNREVFLNGIEIYCKLISSLTDV